MNDEQAQARSDAPREPVGGPALARVRRRGESHRLALISAATVAFIAIAIVKPWGESAPPPGASATTRSPLAEAAASPTQNAPPSEASAETPLWRSAASTETTQYVVIVLQPGQDTADLTGVCTFYAADPSGGSQYPSPDDIRVRGCTDGTVVIEPVVPSPAAP